MRAAHRIHGYESLVASNSQPNKLYQATYSFGRRPADGYVPRSGYLADAQDRIASQHKSTSRLRTISSELTKLDSARVATEATARHELARRFPEPKRDPVGASPLKSSSQCLLLAQHHPTDLDATHRRSNRSNILRESLSRQFLNHAVSKRLDVTKEETKSPKRKTSDSHQYYNILWNERSTKAAQEREKYCSHVLERVQASKEKASRPAANPRDPKSRSSSLKVEDAPNRADRPPKLPEVRDALNKTSDAQASQQLLERPDALEAGRVRLAQSRDAPEKRQTDRDYPLLKLSSKVACAGTNAYLQQAHSKGLAKASPPLAINNIYDEKHLKLYSKINSSAQPAPGLPDPAPEQALLRKTRLSRLVDKIDPANNDSRKLQTEILQLLREARHEDQLVEELVRKAVNYKCAYERLKLAQALVPKLVEPTRKYWGHPAAQPPRSPGKPRPPGDLLSHFDASDAGKKWPGPKPHSLFAKQQLAALSTRRRPRPANKAQSLDLDRSSLDAADDSIMLDGKRASHL